MKCIVCNKKVMAPFQKTTNLNKHLENDGHENLKSWFACYDVYLGTHQTNQIEDKDFNLVMYFITSNTSLIELRNKHLLRMINPKEKESKQLPKIKRFKELIKQVLQKLHKAIEIKVF